MLGRDLAGADLSIDDVARAVARVHPALEIIETRGDFTTQLALALADNAQQKFFVLGPGSAHAGSRLAKIGARASVNGVEVGAGRATPCSATRCAPSRGSRQARRLRSRAEGRDHIMSARSRAIPIARGDRVRTEFERVGVVEASF